MGRMTRKKAAEVAEALHMDGDVLLDFPSENAIVDTKSHTPEPSGRPALGELEVNSADSKSQSEDMAQGLRKSTRGKKVGKKCTAKKEKNPAGGTASLADSSDDQGILPDENESAPSPASEKAAEDLMKDFQELEISNMTLQDTKPKRSQNAAIKLTRSQLAKRSELEVEPKSLVDGLGQTAEERDTMKEENIPVKDIQTPAIKHVGPADDNASTESMATTAIDAPPSPLPTAMPKVIAHLRTDTPAKRSTSNKENVEPLDMDSAEHSANYDALEEAVVTSATPPTSARAITPRPEDHIAALDALDDALEKVNGDIPDVQTSPEKPKARSTSGKREKPAPVVRTTKASQARISMAHNPDVAARTPALGRPRPSTTLGRSSSVRQPGTSNAEPKRLFSGSSSKDSKPATDGEKKEVVIPHSKPRPVSMSFPAPPSKIKSTKAPTQSTFQLPGEAIAAKLKAAREARMQKESEEVEQKKKAFKARPVPASLSKAPSVRQTNASKARESIMTGKDKPSLSASVAAHKRAQSVATTRPSAPKPTTKPTITITGKPAIGDLSVKKRPSTAMASISKPRPSAAVTSAPPSSSTAASRAPINTGKGTMKGKEVFNRPAQAKAAAENEKQEREAAAKKARADAAERGRLASREWAEKQKQRKLGATGAKVEPAKEEGASVVTPESPAQEEQATVGASAVEVGETV